MILLAHKNQSARLLLHGLRNEIDCAQETGYEGSLPTKSPKTVRQREYKIEVPQSDENKVFSFDNYVEHKSYSKHIYQQFI